MIRRSGLDSRGAIPPQWDTGRRWSQSRQAPSHSVRAVRGLVSPAAARLIAVAGAAVGLGLTLPSGARMVKPPAWSK